MHEMSLCEGILQILEDNAKTNGFTKVKRVRLEVGRFAGVEVEALRFGFDIVMRGSLAEGAALEIIDQPGLAHCFGCGETVELNTRLDPCPLCGSGRLSPTGGDDMRIKDLEVV
ncbi:hydrogenase maturation nickel metallochaperone HypA [Rhodospirillum sp. A1_3_36]|uniref:hydrogenase maturation nickel metallochaperone HypA n=1 Tax=Rhodospirillum sp. A1_3_36 TaxID=3391666 RepID=UPI0039A664D6